MARGFTQIHGVDFGETFALVAKFISICTFYDFGVKLYLKIHHLWMSNWIFLMDN